MGSLTEKHQHQLEVWKSKGQPVSVRVLTLKDQETTTEVYRMALSPRHRLLRAAKAWGVCWLLAAATVFIALAHFVLVPGFLIAGPVVAWFRYKQTSLILGGLGMCPACQKELVVKSQAESWPLSAACNACREVVRLEESFSSQLENAPGPP